MKTLSGPHGIKVVLDRAQVFPEDPGAGTPAMVYYAGASATYACAADTGELDGGEVLLGPAQCAWLNSIGPEVDKYLGW